MIVDFHTHIFSPQVRAHRDDYIRRDPCFATLYDQPKARLATAEELVASMDKSGIDMSLVCSIGWTSHKLCVESNDYILESVSRYPGRLVGLAAVQPTAGDKALKELRHCVQGGVKGVGEMRPDIQGFDLSSDRVLTDIAAMLSEHRLIWLSHASEPVGHGYPGKGKLTPQVLYAFILRFPALGVVLAHWGGGLPFYALMPEVRQALGSVYFDTAASPYLYEPAVYPLAIGLVGSGHILFGSDFPLMPQSRPLEEIQSLGLVAEDRQLILGGNAHRLLGLSQG